MISSELKRLALMPLLCKLSAICVIAVEPYVKPRPSLSDSLDYSDVQVNRSYG